MATPLFKWSTTSHHHCISGTVVPRRSCDHLKCAEWPHYGGAGNTFYVLKAIVFKISAKILFSAWYALQFLQYLCILYTFNYVDFYTFCLYYSHRTPHSLCSFLCKCMSWYSCMMLGICMSVEDHRACTVLAISQVWCQHLFIYTHTGVYLVWWLQDLGLVTTSCTADMLALYVLVVLKNSTQAGWSQALSGSCGTAPNDIHRMLNSPFSLIQRQGIFQHYSSSVVTVPLHQTLPVGRDPQQLSCQTALIPPCWYCHTHLGPVAPISVNFNHQLAYFTDQSDTTHVPHQPTAVA